MTSLSGLTVKDLKAKLKQLGLPQGGRKNELIERLQEALKDEVNGNASAEAVDGDGPSAQADTSAAAAPSVDTQPASHAEPEPMQGTEEKHASMKEAPASSPEGRPAQAEANSQQDPPAGGSLDKPGPSADNTATEQDDAPRESPAEGGAEASEPMKEASPAQAEDQAAPAPQAEPPKPPAAQRTQSSDREPSLSMGSEEEEDTAPEVQASAPAQPEAAAAPAPERSAPPAAPTEAPAPKQPTPPEPQQPAKQAPVTTAAPESGAAKRKRAEIVFDPAVEERRDAGARAGKQARKEVHVEAASGETRALRIDGFRRPLREADLKEKLGETGKVEAFWMDSLKSYCYAVFASTADAAATLKATTRLQWPPRTVRSVMMPKFVTLLEAEAVLESNGQVRLQEAPAAAEEPKADAAPANEDVDMEPAPAEAAAVEPAAVERTESGRADMDVEVVAEETTAESIFNITKAGPPLYWLPLPEDQVAERAAADKAKKELEAAAKAERAAKRQARADAKAAADAAAKEAQAKEEAEKGGDGSDKGAESPRSEEKGSEGGEKGNGSDKAAASGEQADASEGKDSEEPQRRGSDSDRDGSPA